MTSKDSQNSQTTNFNFTTGEVLIDKLLTILWRKLLRLRMGTLFVFVGMEEILISLLDWRASTRQNSTTGGRESKEWLRKELEGEEVEILINEKNRVGKFGRLIGTIIIGGININQMSRDFGFSEEF